MKNFYIITNRQKDRNLKVTNYIYNYLISQGAVCTIQIASDSVEKNVPYTDIASIPKETECILVLGGDGTLLQAARDTIERGIPLIGVNLGDLGYLAEIDQSNLEFALKAMLADEYELETRMMLQGKIVRNGQTVLEAQALNDIILIRSGTLKIIQFDIYVNGQFLKGYKADGIIVSTPTGSTGYNMSAGGPIVEPKAKLMVLTPICPHTFNTRSIILAPEDFVTLEVRAGRDGQIQEIEANYDASQKVSLVTGDRIEITNSRKKTKIVKLNKVSFLETLHKKMSES